MSSVFVIYQFCSLSYRDVPVHKGKYSTAIIVSLRLFLSEPARTVNGIYTGQAGILIEGIQFIILALVCVCVCVCACVCVCVRVRVRVRACILCIESTSSLLPIRSPVQ